jgi:hypothetical protein
MGRRKSPINRQLPRGLRVRAGYYSYRSPTDGVEVGIGRDRRKALLYAVEKNMALGAAGREIIEGAGLLSEEDIGSASISFKALCGVYFLLDRQKVVYVGKSSNVHYRLGEHFSKKHMIFDRFHIVPCEACDVDHVEALYIATLRPKYNKDVRIAFADRTNLGGVYRRGSERESESDTQVVDL